MFRPGVDHDTAHIFIQPVDGENISAQLLLQRGGYLRLGVHSHRLDADGDAFIRIENFHTKLLICIFFSIPQTSQFRKGDG